MDAPAEPVPAVAPVTAEPAPAEPIDAIPAANAAPAAPEETMKDAEAVAMEEDKAEEKGAVQEAVAEEAPKPIEEPAAAEEPVAPAAAAATEPPSDDAVKSRLAEVLKTADLSSTTEKMLRKQLEGEFGADLSSKKALIRAEVEAYLAAQAADGAEEAEEEEEDAGTSSRKRKSRGGGGGGAARFGDILSEPMAAFLGLERCPRTMVVKKIWEYVKANDLQDPKDRRRIILDDKLKTLFPGKTINMFSMQKVLSKHVFVEDRVESSEYEEDDSEGEESGSGSEEEESEEERPKKKRAPAKKAPAAKKAKAAGGAAKPNGFTKPCKLAPDLAEWMGVETASRPAITSYLWKYAKERNLQDPANKQFILADETLKALTGEERFKAFSFGKLIKDKVLGYAD